MSSAAPFRKVLVVGGGVMGQQIAVQCRLHGVPVAIYDINPLALEQARDSKAHPTVGFGVLPATIAERNAVLNTLTIETDPGRAALGADLLVEAVIEKLPVKRAVFQLFHPLCAPDCIFATNTSSILPSTLAESTGRPALFAAMHFNLECDMVELMGHPGTAPATLSRLRDFATQLRHLTIDCKTEHPGFVFNNLLMAINGTALALAASGVADYREIDRAWMKAVKVDIGPFGILDGVGLDTAWRVTEYRAQLLREATSVQSAAFLKQFVEQGRLGVKSGQGFYHYPDPEFARPEFLASAAN